MEKPDDITIRMAPRLVERLPAILRETAFHEEPVYLVGGAVRDLFLGREPSDYDLAVEGDAAVLAGRMARKTGARLVVLCKERFPLHRLVLPDLTVDVESVAGPGILADLARRDFTANALAMRLGSDLVLDPFGGRSDMEAGVVRAVSENNLRTDPLRMLRAYRFAASLDWRPAPDTVAAIARHHDLIRNVVPERIHEELSRILTSGRADAAFAAMAESGLLFDIVPELRPLMGLIQNPRYHAHDGWTHTLAVVRRLQEILNHPESMMPADVLPMMTAWLNPEIRGLLLWIALLHDVAKPVMSRPGPSGAPRFHGHDTEGGRMAADICRRLRFPGRHVGTVADIVSRHMRPLSLFQARRRGELGQRGIMRFSGKTNGRPP